MRICPEQTLAGANPSDANLSDAKTWPRLADAKTAIYADADLAGAKPAHANLADVNLVPIRPGANLAGANLSDVSLACQT